MSPLPGVRNLQVESIYEYGSRVGFWRLLRLFAGRDIRISVCAVAMALERHPDAARAIVEAGHEVVSHGWRWIDYQFVDEDVEREHMRLAVESLTRVTGSRPLGWYTGRLSPNTRRLVVANLTGPDPGKRIATSRAGLRECVSLTRALRPRAVASRQGGLASIRCCDKPRRPRSRHPRSRSGQAEPERCPGQAPYLSFPEPLELSDP